MKPLYMKGLYDMQLVGNFSVMVFTSSEKTLYRGTMVPPYKIRTQNLVLAIDRWRMRRFLMPKLPRKTVLLNYSMDCAANGWWVIAHAMLRAFQNHFLIWLYFLIWLTLIVSDFVLTTTQLSPGFRTAKQLLSGVYFEFLHGFMLRN